MNTARPRLRLLPSPPQQNRIRTVLKEFPRACALGMGPALGMQASLVFGNDHTKAFRHNEEYAFFCAYAWLRRTSHFFNEAANAGVSFHDAYRGLCAHYGQAFSVVALAMGTPRPVVIEALNAVVPPRAVPDFVRPRMDSGRLFFEQTDLDALHELLDRLQAPRHHASFGAKAGMVSLRLAVETLALGAGYNEEVLLRNMDLTGYRARPWSDEDELPF